jgi:hypothetical protein
MNFGFKGHSAFIFACFFNGKITRLTKTSMKWASLFLEIAAFCLLKDQCILFDCLYSKGIACALKTLLLWIWDNLVTFVL